MMKCQECVFWKVQPGGKPDGWGKCARLSGNEYVTLLADAEGGRIQHVKTPPEFGCNQIEYPPCRFWSSSASTARSARALWSTKSTRACPRKRRT